jgi:hypothetical protein
MWWLKYLIAALVIAGAITFFTMQTPAAKQGCSSCPGKKDAH